MFSPFWKKFNRLSTYYYSAYYACCAVIAQNGFFFLDMFVGFPFGTFCEAAADLFCTASSLPPS